MGFNDGVDWTRVMYGENAIQVPLNLTIQRMDDGIVLVVGASKFTAPNPLMFGSKLGHVKFLGDAVLRPHWVGESGELAGSGAAALMTGPSFGDPDQWTTLLGSRP